MKSKTQLIVVNAIAFNHSEIEIISTALSQYDKAKSAIKEGGFWHSYISKGEKELIAISKSEFELILDSLDKMCKLHELMFSLDKSEEVVIEGNAFQLWIDLDKMLKENSEIKDKGRWELVSEKEHNESRNKAYQYLL